tara:strand:+ start:696 stop:2804 length:2109 start_codon:yes stop_codon:yes gene_type:complete
MAETVIYEYDLPDGSILELEGEVGQEAKADAEYKRIIATEFAPKPELTKGQTALDYAKSTGSGAYKGLSYIPGFPGDIEQLGQQFLPEWMTNPIIEGAKPIQVFPTSAQIRGMAETVVPALEGAAEFKPQTTGGRYLQTGMEWAAPGGVARKGAKTFGLGLGFGSGALYETVESTSGSPGFASAVTIPAMLTAGFLGGPSKAATLAERSLVGVSEKEIAKAINLENAAKIAGIKLLPGEALDNKMVAQLTESVLKSDLGSAYIYEAIKNRPKEVAALVGKQANKISGLPESQRAVFKMISDTAKTNIKQAKKTRTNKAQNAGYKVADDQDLPAETVLNIIDGINAIRVGQNSPSASKLQNIKDQLTKEVIRDKKTKEIIEIIPETNINNLSSTYKQYKKEVDASNKELVVGGERFVIEDLRSKLYNADETGALDFLGRALNTNPAYKAGNEKFAELSNSLVKVVEENVLPLSKKKIDLSKIENFVFNPKGANKTDIDNTLSTLNKTNPQATIEIANVYFRNAINNSFGINKKGADLTEGFDFVEAVIGKKGKKRENFLAVINNVADARKVSRKDLKVGFENMLSILERTGRISNINKPGFDVQGLARKNLINDVAAAKTFNPLVRMATKYSELRAGGSMDSLGRIMASPESTKLLVELGRTNPQSKAAIKKTMRAIGLVSPFREDQPEQPYWLENLQINKQQ